MSENQLDTNQKETLELFEQLDQKITHYNELLSLANWDFQTGAPKKGKGERSKAVGTLSTEVFELSTSEEMGKYLEILSAPDVYNQLDESTQGMIEVRKRDYEKTKKIPSSLYKEFVILTSDAHDIWEEAKTNNDFAHYQPTLERIVDILKQFAEYFGYEGHPYNALLDIYEPGLTVDRIDTVFTDLRKKTINLLERIQKSPHQPQESIFDQQVDIEKQKAFSLFVLPKIGYDLNAGRLDESAHPFATGLNTGDVRITTHYLEHDVRSALFGTIHECGHALYEQGVDDKYNGTSLRGGTSMGIHESQSRFLENMVGRSKEFWRYFYEDFKQHFPGQFDDVPLDEFCRAINTVKPSFIRIEADELTYNLHIMIRYEIEKGLIAGAFEVKDLPQIWNEKMKEYLGVVPSNDTDGVLQDVHWSFGGFGYFPSYTLGNLYSAQFAQALRKDIPDVDQKIENGEFTAIREWLKENIHQYGKLYTPSELVVKVTGEELNADYLVNYLEQKYTEVYRLS